MVPPNEPIGESFLADDEHDFNELRQRVVSDDFEALHESKTPRGYRSCKRASLSPFTANSTPSILKPTSTPLSGRRTEQGKARDRERFNFLSTPKASAPSRREERGAARNGARSSSRGRPARRAVDITVDGGMFGSGSPYEVSGAAHAIRCQHWRQA